MKPSEDEIRRALLVSRYYCEDHPPVGVAAGGISVGGTSVGGTGVGVDVGVGGTFKMMPGTNQNALALSGVPPFTCTVKMNRTCFPAWDEISKSILVILPS